MNNKYLKLGIYSVILILVISLSVVLYNNISKNYTPEDSNIDSSDSVNTAPDFITIDQNGDLVSLSDFEGNPVVINFWATWCGYCVEELPYFEEAYKTYGDDVQFMMINLDGGSAEKITAFLRRNGYNFPVYYDSDSVAASIYDASALPVTVFIDADGNLVYRRVGMMTKKMLFDNIENLLGE